MSATRPLLRTPLGLTAAGLLLLGVALEVALGGGPEWYSLDGRTVFRTDYDVLGLSREAGTLSPLADAFIQVYAASMFFAGVAVALAAWTRRIWTKLLAALALVGIAAGVTVQARDAGGLSDPPGADHLMVVVATGLVTAAALVGLATMLLGVPRWIRSAAGGLLVVVFAVGQGVGLVQTLSASGASPTATSVSSVAGLVLIAASLLVLMPACAAVDRRARDEDLAGSAHR